MVIIADISKFIAFMGIIPIFLIIAIIFYFILIRPVIGVIAAIAGFAFINPNLLPPLVEIGPFTFRIPDAITTIVAIIAFIRIIATKRFESSKEWLYLFNPLFGFLSYIGLSLCLVAIYTPHFLLSSLASYMRLIATIALSWILYISLQNSYDLRIFAQSVIFLSLGSIGVGSWEVLLGSEVWIGRYGGFLGINTLGLISGLLILYGIISHQLKEFTVSSIFSIFIGLWGLILSKSISSILATLLVITAIWSSLTKKKIKNILSHKFAIIAIITIPAFMVIVWFLRRSDVEGLLTLSGGSLAQRLMIAYAGLQIFLKHPIFGVGWQASSTPKFISDLKLNEILMLAFPNLPDHYFFISRSTSLHNMYVQILAELGLIGFILFLLGLIRIKGIVVNILNNTNFQPLHKKWVIFCYFGLIYLLIWWNTNPLYGGQTETVLAFSFLSYIAAIWKIERKRSLKNN